MVSVPQKEEEMYYPTRTQAIMVLNIFSCVNYLQNAMLPWEWSGFFLLSVLEFRIPSHKLVVTER